MRLAKIYAGHHPDNHASKHILETLGFTFLETVFYEPTGLLHPFYFCNRPDLPPTVATDPTRRQTISN